MQRTALITGITGQDGSYLCELLLKKGYIVIGLVSQKYNIGWQNIEHIKDKLVIENGDLLDSESLSRVFNKYQLNEVYNLGGLTFVPQSWEKPTVTLDINLLGVSRILEIITTKHKQTRFYQASTAKIFGLPTDVPQTESTKVQPLDPYSVSKAAAHFLVQSMRQQFDVFAVSGILYNHESQRRGVEFVTRKITQTAVKIKLGQVKKLELGDLDAQADWGYAPDYVEAMWLMLQQEKPDDFIIATGELHSVRDICETAFGYLKLDYQNFVTISEQFVRKTEAKALTGNPSKANRVLGWQPKTSFKDMIINMVKHDLNLCQNQL